MPVRVAAVVTAHDRTQFLADAVRSALDGGADEVIVVRNFAGPIAGCDGRYVDVPCATPETNEKEAVGLERSTADVVAFLDDDDRWTREKVPALRAAFDRAPNLVYLNHAQTPIGEDDRPVVAGHPELAVRDAARFLAWDRTDFRTLVTSIWPGNNSSTVVRRAWAVGWLPTFRRAGWAADISWLVGALLHGAPLEVVPERWTELRLHGENMSHQRAATPEGFRTGHQRTCERFARSMAALATAARSARGERDPMVRYLARKAAAFHCLAAVEADRGARRAALAALRAGAGWGDRGVLATSLAALGSPAFARRLLYRSSLRRWELRRTGRGAV